MDYHSFEVTIARRFRPTLLVHSLPGQTRLIPFPLAAIIFAAFLYMYPPGGQGPQHPPRAAPGDVMQIREEFAPTSRYNVVLDVRADGFDPASADRESLGAATERKAADKKP